MQSVNLVNVEEPITLEGLANAVQANTREMRWAMEMMMREIEELRRGR